jgi:chemotaxis family two-component system response regulator Rcp1
MAMMRAYSLNYQAAAGQCGFAAAHARPRAVPRARSANVEGLLIVKYSRDARVIREALDLARIEHGLTVTTDGLEALSFLQSRGNFTWIPRPDFIVLDLELDKVSGPLVLDAIRMEPEMCSLPVILLGGTPADWNLSQGHDPKTRRFVSKPVELDALAAEFLSVRNLIRS